jgi:hypothetical protein
MRTAPTGSGVTVTVVERSTESMRTVIRVVPTLSGWTIRWRC